MDDLCGLCGGGFDLEFDVTELYGEQVHESCVRTEFLEADKMY